MAEERQCSECGGKLPADTPEGMCPQCLMKLGLGTGAKTEKAGPTDEGSDVPTTGTPPGRFVPLEPAELAKQFPQLEILELLGQGGMGAVYKARQKQLDRVVALKILPPEVGQTEAFAERFTREARSLARLNHPRIVTVFDFGHTEDGLYYFVMEYVDGTDLRHVIQAGKLEPSEALAIVPQVCEALQFAHEEGIVHRDIKPENILIDKKGRVKIADFGLAKLLDKPATEFTLTADGHRMGTPHYMAPEQIEHPGQVDHRADIYSLGVVFYEMLTGELPIGRFAPPSHKVQVDVRLDNVVLRTLEKEPERRYQHASEVKTDVETIKADSRPPMAPIAPASAGKEKQQVTQTKPDRRSVLIGLVVAGVAIVLTALIGLLFVLPALWLTTSRHTSRPDEEIAVMPLAPGVQISGPQEVSVVMPPAPGVQKIGELDFPYGIEGDLTFGQEGPTLSDECTGTLELEPSEAAQVHKILRRAYRQYLELERQNTQQYRAVNSLTVIISPFREEAESFLKQFWADLDSILDKQKRTIARRHLPLGQMFGTFQFGGPKVTIAVSKVNDVFNYATIYEWPKGSSKVGGRSSVDMAGRSNTLPSKYRRFWEQSATDE